MHALFAPEANAYEFQSDTIVTMLVELKDEIYPLLSRQYEKTKLYLTVPLPYRSIHGVIQVIGGINRLFNFIDRLINCINRLINGY